jgi:hypothetical protein
MNPNLVFYKKTVFNDGYITNTDQLDKIERYFPIHKVFLSSKSKIFKTLFENHNKPICLHPNDKKEVYYISGDIPLDVLDYFLQYFYIEDKNAQKFYSNIIKNNKNLLNWLCDLFEKYDISEYKSFMLKSFKLTLTNYPEYINDLINTCIIYKLDQILIQLIHQYIEKKYKYYLNLQSQHSKVIIDLLIICINTYINSNNTKYNICEFLAKHKTMTPEIKLSIFSNINIYVPGINQNNLIKTYIYEEDYKSFMYLMDAHYANYKNSITSNYYDDDDKYTPKKWYPLILKGNYIGTVSKINPFGKNQMKIIFRDCKIEEEPDCNYLVFYESDNKILQSRKIIFI